MPLIGEVGRLCRLLWPILRRHTCVGLLRRQLIDLKEILHAKTVWSLLARVATFLIRASKLPRRPILKKALKHAKLFLEYFGP